MSPQSSQRREERLSKSIYSIVYFQVMMEFGVKKLVFSSSATVYGQPQYLPVDENHPTGRKLGHLKDVSNVVFALSRLCIQATARIPTERPSSSWRRL